jgi:hypothetical protein
MPRGNKSLGKAQTFVAAEAAQFIVGAGRGPKGPLYPTIWRRRAARLKPCPFKQKGRKDVPLKRYATQARLKPCPFKQKGRRDVPLKRYATQARLKPCPFRQKSRKDAPLKRYATQARLKPFPDTKQKAAAIILIAAA